MAHSALIIDADPASLKLHAVILRGAGWWVVTALTLEDARNALNVFVPDVIVDGLGGEATRALRDEVITRKIPLVTVEDRDTSPRRSGAVAVQITKPIDVSSFVEQVERARGGER